MNPIIYVTLWHVKGFRQDSLSGLNNKKPWVRGIPQELEKVRHYTRRTISAKILYM